MTKLKSKLALQVLATLLPIALSGVLFARGRALKATSELEEALSTSDYASVRRLAGLASDVNVRSGTSDPALVAALLYDDLPTAHLLVSRGADVNLRAFTMFQEPFTPLGAAVETANVEAVQLLLAHGARVQPPIIARAQSCENAVHVGGEHSGECVYQGDRRRQRLILPLLQRAAREQQVLAGS